jgi:hypothetical protein
MEVDGAEAYHAFNRIGRGDDMEDGKAGKGGRDKDETRLQDIHM